jgi:phage tail protein X
MATYTTKSGDMWDSIAYSQLGSSSYADELMEANTQYKDLFLFPSGVVLTLPEITVTVSSQLPPWKRKGANG